MEKPRNGRRKDKLCVIASAMLPARFPLRKSGREKHTAPDSPQTADSRHPLPAPTHEKPPQPTPNGQTVRHRLSDAPGAISLPEIGSGGAHRTRQPAGSRQPSSTPCPDTRETPAADTERTNRASSPQRCSRRDFPSGNRVGRSTPHQTARRHRPCKISAPNTAVQISPSFNQRHLCRSIRPFLPQ